MSEIIKITSENINSIKSIVDKYSSCAEHNIYLFLNSSSKGDINVFFKEGECGILAHYTELDTWKIFSEPLAPEDLKCDLIFNFLNYINGEFNLPGKKVIIEDIKLPLRKEILKRMKYSNKYRCSRLNYSLSWPVFDMSVWNGDLMQGGDWKDIRYYWHKFFKEHRVEFKTAAEVDKQEMINLVHEWKKQRTTGDRASIDIYTNMINSNFEGFDNTRIMCVDGRVCAITAGYKLANQNYYYSAIGIYNRAFDRIGEIANMDDLIKLKKEGYKLVDFGGSFGKLKDFKKKFRATNYYDTYVFSIVKQ